MDPAEWDRLALELGGSFFHCHAHGQFESCRPNTQPLYAKVLDESGQCAALAVAAVESPRLWPFGRYCKKATLAALPVAQDGDRAIQEAALALLEGELKSRGVYLLEVSSYDSPHSETVLTSQGYRLENILEFYLDLTQPEETLWQNLKDTRRNKLRKAEKVGLRTEIENSEKGVELLYGFQEASMQRRGIDFKAGYPLGVIKELLLDTGRAILLVTYQGQTPLNASLFVFFGQSAYYHNSGSSPQGNKLAGPVHLLWTALKLFKEKGLKTFNFGGVPVPEGTSDPFYGLYSFKRDFGTEMKAQPAGKKILSSTGRKLSNLLSIIKKG